MQRIGVLGCTADPIQNGHLDVADWVASTFQLDAMLIMIAATPPHKKGVMTPTVDRLAMAKLAVADRPLLTVSELELDHPEEPYTYQTVDRLHQIYGREAAIYWVIGSDWVANMHRTWRNYEYLLSQIKLVVLARPSYPLVPPQLPNGHTVRYLSAENSYDLGSGEASVYLATAVGDDSSSTAIRELLAEGKSIDNLTPRAVVSYIAEHHLYEREV